MRDFLGRLHLNRAGHQASAIPELGVLSDVPVLSLTTRPLLVSAEARHAQVALEALVDRRTATTVFARAGCGVSPVHRGPLQAIKRSKKARLQTRRAPALSPSRWSNRWLSDRSRALPAAAGSVSDVMGGVDASWHRT